MLSKSVVVVGALLVCVQQVAAFGFNPKKQLGSCVNHGVGEYGTCEQYLKNKWCENKNQGRGWKESSWGKLDLQAEENCCECGGGKFYEKTKIQGKGDQHKTTKTVDCKAPMASMCRTFCVGTNAKSPSCTGCAEYTQGCANVKKCRYGVCPRGQKVSFGEKIAGYHCIVPGKDGNEQIVMKRTSKDMDHGDHTACSKISGAHERAYTCKDVNDHIKNPGLLGVHSFSSCAEAQQEHMHCCQFEKQPNVQTCPSGICPVLNDVQGKSIQLEVPKANEQLVVGHHCIKKFSGKLLIVKSRQEEDVDTGECKTQGGFEMNFTCAQLEEGVKHPAETLRAYGIEVTRYWSCASMSAFGNKCCGQPQNGKNSGLNVGKCIRGACPAGFEMNSKAKNKTAGHHCVNTSSTRHPQPVISTRSTLDITRAAQCEKYTGGHEKSYTCDDLDVFLRNPFDVGLMTYWPCSKMQKLHQKTCCQAFEPTKECPDLQQLYSTERGQGTEATGVCAAGLKVAADFKIAGHHCFVAGQVVSTRITTDGDMGDVRACQKKKGVEKAYTCGEVNYYLQNPSKEGHIKYTSCADAKKAHQHCCVKVKGQNLGTCTGGICPAGMAIGKNAPKVAGFYCAKFMNETVNGKTVQKMYVLKSRKSGDYDTNECVQHGGFEANFTCGFADLAMKAPQATLKDMSGAVGASITLTRTTSCAEAQDFSKHCCGKTNGQNVEACGAQGICPAGQSMKPVDENKIAGHHCIVKGSIMHIRTGNSDYEDQQKCAKTFGGVEKNFTCAEAHEWAINPWKQTQGVHSSYYSCKEMQAVHSHCCTIASAKCPTGVCSIESKVAAPYKIAGFHCFHSNGTYLHTRVTKDADMGDVRKCTNDGGKEKAYTCDEVNKFLSNPDVWKDQFTCKEAQASHSHCCVRRMSVNAEGGGKCQMDGKEAGICTAPLKMHNPDKISGFACIKNMTDHFAVIKSRQSEDMDTKECALHGGFEMNFTCGVADVYMRHPHELIKNFSTALGKQLKLTSYYTCEQDRAFTHQCCTAGSSSANVGKCKDSRGVCPAGQHYRGNEDTIAGHHCIKDGNIVTTRSSQHLNTGQCATHKGIEKNYTCGQMDQFLLNPTKHLHGKLTWYMDCDEFQSFHSHCCVQESGTGLATGQGNGMGSGMGQGNGGSSGPPIGAGHK